VRAFRFVIAFFIVSLGGLARADAPSPAFPEATFSEWGAPGLLQTPTARLPAAGTVTSGVSLLRGVHRHVFAGLSPMPWLWLGLRQTAYVNDYDLLEPGVDAALRVMEEGPLTPALAVGWRDGLGTGIHLPGIGRFAGEYLVASKRLRSWDFSAGVGWGRLGERRAFANPVAGRNAARPLTGPAARGPRNWFSGDHVGVFGGVSWRTPLDGLTLSAEISADARRAERSEDTSLRRPAPVNVGATWRLPDPYDALEIGAAVEGGRDVMLRALLRFGPEALALDRPGPPPPLPHPRSRTGRDIEDSLPSGPFQGALPLFDKQRDNDDDEAADDRTTGGQRTIWLLRPVPSPAPLGREMGRALRLSAATGSPDAELLTVAVRPAGLAGPALTVPRAGLLRAARGDGSAEESLRAGEVASAFHAPAPPAFPWAWRSLSASLRLGVEESLFEHGLSRPNRVYADSELTWSPAPGVILGGAVRGNGPSTLAGLNTWILPAARPVRSDLPLYADAGMELERAYLALRRSLSPDWHVGFDVGWLEEMFGGFGGEALYQPFGARWAAGASLHQMWKRRAGELFRLDYNRGVVTGLGELHYEGVGAAWTASLEAGRYLGGDWGGGARFIRRLNGDASLQAHAVLTDGPGPQQAWLGGKMEFGARLVLPLNGLGAVAMEWLTGEKKPPAPLRLDAAVRTLGRDAGQKPDRPAPLYETLAASGVGRLSGTWRHLLD
jgi:hypothetical protein